MSRGNLFDVYRRIVVEADGFGRDEVANLRDLPMPAFQQLYPF